VCLKEDIDNDITFHETPWDNTQINDDETLTQNSDECAVKQWDDVGISKEEMENTENKLICQKDPENPELKETETKDTDTSDSEPNDTETKDIETNDPETSDSETKDTETKDTETKDTETKDPEPKETEPKETELKYIEPKSRAKKKKK
jgi:hypothetical protein